MTYSQSWKHRNLVAGAQPIAEVSTTKKHPLGTIVQAEEISNGNGMGEFIYVQGVASGAQGSWVTINEDDFSTALLAANAIGRVGILQAALVASTYGWAQIGGKAVGKAAAGYADNGLVYATATAGTVDDAVVAGDRVKQAIGASAIDAPATGMAEFEIDRPFMDDATAA